jgi:hypothetical protein
MIAKVTSVRIGGFELPCKFEVDLDNEDVYIETRNSAANPPAIQRIRLDLKGAIQESPFRRKHRELEWHTEEA